MRPDLSRRSAEREWLDDCEPPPGELDRIMRDLARFNGAMLGRLAVLRWLAPALRQAPRDRPVTVIDIGCRYGDLLRAIARWARRRHIPLRLRGIDLNPAAITVAAAATAAGEPIEYRVMDGLRLAPGEGADFIVSSLFAHHLSDAEIVRFLRVLEGCASRGWLVCDLVRHAFPHRAVGLCGRLLRIHPRVVADGLVSVRRALTRGEWERLLARAEVPREAVRIERFLYRHLIGRHK